MSFLRNLFKPIHHNNQFKKEDKETNREEYDEEYEKLFDRKLELKKRMERMDLRHNHYYWHV